MVLILLNWFASAVVVVRIGGTSQQPLSHQPFVTWDDGSGPTTLALIFVTIFIFIFVTSDDGSVDQPFNTRNDGSKRINPFGQGQMGDQNPVLSCLGCGGGINTISTL